MPVEAARAVAPLPPPLALELGQDRLVEKQLFQRLGIPTARFGSLADSGLPALVKSRRLGYDGKGQRRVALDEELGEHELAEEIVPFDRELSIIAVRGRDGETRFWPLAENVHRDGILRISRSPAVAAPQAEAEELVRRLLEELDYVGVLALELFEVDGRLLANEFAPRVHNTGHWTIDGAVTSQFENHLRAILGLPLGVDRRDRAGGDAEPDRRCARVGEAASSFRARTSTSTARHRGPVARSAIVTLIGASEGTVAEATALVEGSADG